MVETRKNVVRIVLAEKKIQLNDLKKRTKAFDAHPNLLAVRNMLREKVFLSHSHKDKDLVKGLIELFDELGADLYIDWNDPSMPPVPDSETAENIVKRISERKKLLFLATPNSVDSRWCPWEIGVAQGFSKEILIISTVDDDGDTIGSEYLDLYERIVINRAGNLERRSPGSTEGEEI